MRDIQLVLPIPPAGLDLQAVFPDRRACLAAVVEARWPDGFACPACGRRRCWLHRNRPVVECAGCGTQTSPLAGTLFANTKLPLPRLFELCRAMAVNPEISEAELARRTGVSQPTAGAWRRKLGTRIAKTEPGKVRIIITAG